jgi:Bacterial PH domain
VIDFQNGTFVKLGPTDPQSLSGELEPLLAQGEHVHLAFKGLRDSVVFTDKRLISINVQGFTGKKRDYTSLPLNRVQAWSVETAGTFDLDSELELWFSGRGKVRLEFKGSVNIKHLSQLIAQHAL